MDINNRNDQNGHQRTNQQRQRRNNRCRRQTRNRRFRNVQSKQTTAPKTNRNKRKRDIFSAEQELTINTTLPKSISSISILQPSLKKLKRKTKIKGISSIRGNSNVINTTYRRPLYLKQKLSVLFHTLNEKLKNLLKKKFNDLSKKKNKSDDLIKKKSERRFLYRRLILFDQKRCLELDQQLWQSYLEFGLEKHTWPVQLHTKVKTNDPELCQQYLVNYLETIKKQLNQYELELTNQAQLCPITKLALNEIDRILKEYVDCQRKQLSSKKHRQLIRFKEDFHHKHLLHTLSTYRLTNEQNEYINRLISIRQKQSEIWKELLMFETRILCKFLPPNFDHLESLIAPNIGPSTLDNQSTIQLANKRYKIIQEAKRLWLDVFLNVYEIQIEEYERTYENEFVQFQSQLLFTNTTINRTCVVNDICEYITYQTNKFKQDIYRQILSYRRTLLQRRQHSKLAKQTVGVSPEPYLDLLSNPFNQREWNYLTLGPSFIRLNQSAIRPEKQQQIEIKKEHQDIYNKVQKHLTSDPYRLPLKTPILTEYSNHLLDYLNRTYSVPLFHEDQLQALAYDQIMKSIRQKIKKQKLILRLTDKSNNFYIGSANEFDKKAQKFFHETNAFIELSYNPFHEILNKVIQLLNRLRSEKLILAWQHGKMMPDRKNAELAHLYFNPKTHKDDIPVRPIENTIHASTTKISKFLDTIIRPIFNDRCRTTTIIDGADLITQLTKYIEKGLFKSSTLFCTFDIRNLYTMLPQEQSLDILIEFLQFHGYTKVKGVELQAIKELASIVLQENVFIYGNKIYKQTTGGAMGSSFTLTLANVFMWKWQQELVSQQHMASELFGRYIDDIFMTWNKSEKELIELLDKVNQWHPNIKLDYKIGKSLPFLDVLLTNKHGHLLTSSYHKPAAEPYVVPFLSDHPRHIFANVIQTALNRATRYSSTFELFQQERRHIKLMLLYNGYPCSFIDKEYRKFFLQYKSLSSLAQPFIPYFQDEKIFFHMRHIILGQPTPQQSQVMISATTADMNNNQKDPEPYQPILNEELKQNQSKKKLFIHYTHEKRFHSFKKDMHKLYEHIFNDPSVRSVKMIVGSRNRRNSTKELINKRPNKYLLQNKPIKKRKKRRQNTAESNLLSNQVK